jgi:hypothetical protein
MGIRDNAANMVSTMRIAQMATLDVSLTLLQLVPHDALFRQATKM